MGADDTFGQVIGRFKGTQLSYDLLQSLYLVDQNKGQCRLLMRHTAPLKCRPLIYRSSCAEYACGEGSLQHTLRQEVSNVCAARGYKGEWSGGVVLGRPDGTTLRAQNERSLTSFDDLQASQHRP